MTPKERLKALRERASAAEAQFHGAMEGVRLFEYEETFLDLVHDNVRIVEADGSPFGFGFEEAKQQIVVILRGSWRLRHGNTIQTLGVADVRKVPIESGVATRMETDEAGAKFVYIQFK